MPTAARGMTVKPLVEKVLKSGIIDRATASLMEKYGLLEEGSADKVDEKKLEKATREELIKIADSLAEEVEKEQRMRETYLDLDKLRWPTKVQLVVPAPKGSLTGTVPHSWVEPTGYGFSRAEPRWLSAVRDRMGRYYFRFQDVEKEWFVPGLRLRREDGPRDGAFNETILEVNVLDIEQTPVAIQVTTEED